MRRSRRLGLVALVVLALAGVVQPALATPAPSGSDATAALPTVMPRPQALTRNGPGVVVRGAVRLQVGAEVDAPTRDLVVAVLRAAGADTVEVAGPSAPQGSSSAVSVVVGSVADERVATALRAAGGQAPQGSPAEGYALASKANRTGGGLVVLAGVDSDGIYYAAQTLRQLVRKPVIAAVTIADYPLMPLRGAIEGFYGSPWTHAERLDQLAFYGSVKLNTYIYAPKDDPYHREQWREPYPAEKLAQLGELVRQATAHHVRFTFALSPGVSICYSDAADTQALEAKLRAMYDLGVRSFSIPLDDITYTRWNCASDQTAYGDPSAQAAAQAQVDLLNRIQREFLDTLAGTNPLQMVPTEYGDVNETAYKRILREQLDTRVEVMWTGTDVVPPSISVADAQQAAQVWGRKVFVWDNYPVNDYGNTTGRLLLAPYAEREPGLHTQLSGIVLNPMNQAAASKVALFGGADFTWHDTGYQPEPTSLAAAEYLAAGDAATVRALLAFFDLEHLAPTFGSQPWQPQAPELARRLAEFRTAWAGGGTTARTAALRELRPYARLLAGASERIRSRVADPGFVADCQPWLDALALWGPAFVDTLDALQARVNGDEDRAAQLFAEAADLMAQAQAIRTIPGETRPQGRVRVGDGVLDTFLIEARTLS
ncbi:beta-N-acetylhexosaminidase family protein [Flindersiella endophytica]